jgi:hypothetical protein
VNALFTSRSEGFQSWGWGHALGIALLYGLLCVLAGLVDLIALVFVGAGAGGLFWGLILGQLCSSPKMMRWPCFFALQAAVLAIGTVGVFVAMSVLMRDIGV